MLIHHSLLTHSSNGTTVVLVYVDDLIITGDDQFKIDCVKKNLKQKFEIKDLGRLKYFLGIEIARSSKELFIYQQKYILKILKETGKLGSKPTITPTDINVKLNSEDGEPLEDVN
jgi:Reverse transcriptase (RNA-dependent DNA polymerase)